MREFDGYRRVAVVVVPEPAVFEERQKKREESDGKEVPDGAVMDMKGWLDRRDRPRTSHADIAPMPPLINALFPRSQLRAAREVPVDRRGDIRGAERGGIQEGSRGVPQGGQGGRRRAGKGAAGQVAHLCYSTSYYAVDEISVKWRGHWANFMVWIDRFFVLFILLPYP